MAGKKTILIQLCELAQQAFNGQGRSRPLFKDVQKIRLLMEEVSLNDVGIPAARLRDIVEQPRKGSTAYVMDIFECESFNMVLFAFPKGFQMQVHDHPGMIVITKILMGDMTVNCWDRPGEEAYDDSFMDDPLTGYGSCCPLAHGTTVNCRKSYVADVNITTDSDGRPIVSISEKFVGNNASLLYPSKLTPSTFLALPTRGNLHLLKCQDTTVILDILSRPYDPYHGRPCTFLHVRDPSSTSAIDELTVLEEGKGGPENFIRIPYNGPGLIL